MKFRRIKIENIATYIDQEINFSELAYPVFVTGKTGAGKTTLFIDAITAALFGSAYGRKEREFGKVLIMKGKKTGKIILDFEISNKIYRVERIFRENEVSQARLIQIDGGESRLISSSLKVVDYKIKELTGLTFDILINSAMVRQGDVYKFLEVSPSERRNMLVEVLKINLDILKDKAKEKRQKLENRIHMLESQISILQREISDKEKIIDEIEKLSKEEIPNLEKKLVIINKDIKKIKDEIR